MITFFPSFFTYSRSSRSSSSSSLEMSKTSITSIAFLSFFFAISTPIFSTSSSVSCIPAVSESFKISSPSFALSSITSRVVPATFVTMERSYPNSIFMRVDFPTFGLPAITVSTPFFSIIPLS